MSTRTGYYSKSIPYNHTYKGINKPLSSFGSSSQLDDEDGEDDLIEIPEDSDIETGITSVSDDIETDNSIEEDEDQQNTDESSSEMATRQLSYSSLPSLLLSESGNNLAPNNGERRRSLSASPALSFDSVAMELEDDDDDDDRDIDYQDNGPEQDENESSQEYINLNVKVEKEPYAMFSNTVKVTVKVQPPSEAEMEYESSGSAERKSDSETEYSDEYDDDEYGGENQELSERTGSEGQSESDLESREHEETDEGFKEDRITRSTEKKTEQDKNETNENFLMGNDKVQDLLSAAIDKMDTLPDKIPKVNELEDSIINKLEKNISNSEITNTAVKQIGNATVNEAKKFTDGKISIKNEIAVKSNEVASHTKDGIEKAKKVQEAIKSGVNELESVAKNELTKLSTTDSVKIASNVNDIINTSNTSKKLSPNEIQQAVVDKIQTAVTLKTKDTPVIEASATTGKPPLNPLAKALIVVPAEVKENLQPSTISSVPLKGKVQKEESSNTPTETDKSIQSQKGIDDKDEERTLKEIVKTEEVAQNPAAEDYLSIYADSVGTTDEDEDENTIGKQTKKITQDEINEIEMAKDRLIEEWKSNIKEVFDDLDEKFSHILEDMVTELREGPVEPVLPPELKEAVKDPEPVELASIHSESINGSEGTINEEIDDENSHEEGSQETENLGSKGSLENSHSNGSPKLDSPQSSTPLGSNDSLKVGSGNNDSNKKQSHVKNPVDSTELKSSELHYKNSDEILMTMPEKNISVTETKSVKVVDKKPIQKSGETSHKVIGAKPTGTISTKHIETVGSKPIGITKTKPLENVNIKPVGLIETNSLGTSETKSVGITVETKPLDNLGTKSVGRASTQLSDTPETKSIGRAGIKPLDNSGTRSVGRASTKLSDTPETKSVERAGIKPLENSIGRASTKISDTPETKSIGKDGTKPPDNLGTKSLGRAGIKPPDNSETKSVGRAGIKPPDNSGPKSVGRAGIKPPDNSGPKSVGSASMPPGTKTLDPPKIKSVEAPGIKSLEMVHKKPEETKEVIKTDGSKSVGQATETTESKPLGRGRGRAKPLETAQIKQIESNDKKSVPSSDMTFESVKENPKESISKPSPKSSNIKPEPQTKQTEIVAVTGKIEISSSTESDKYPNSLIDNPAELLANSSIETLPREESIEEKLEEYKYEDEGDLNSLYNLENHQSEEEVDETPEKTRKWNNSTEIASTLSQYLYLIQTDTVENSVSEIIPLLTELLMTSRKNKSEYGIPTLIATLSAVRVFCDRLLDVKALKGSSGEKALRNMDLSWLLRVLCKISADADSKVQTEASFSLAKLVKAAGPVLIIRPIYFLLVMENEGYGHRKGAQGSKTKAAALDTLAYALLTFPKDEFEDLEEIARWVCLVVFHNHRRVRQSALECISVLGNRLGNPDTAISKFRQFITREAEMRYVRSDSDDSTVAKKSTGFGATSQDIFDVTPITAISTRVRKRILPLPSPYGLIEYGVKVPTGQDLILLLTKLQEKEEEAFEVSTSDASVNSNKSDEISFNEDDSEMESIRMSDLERAVQDDEEDKFVKKPVKRKGDDIVELITPDIAYVLAGKGRVNKQDYKDVEMEENLKLINDLMPPPKSLRNKKHKSHKKRRHKKRRSANKDFSDSESIEENEYIF